MKTEKELRDCAKWPGASTAVTTDGKDVPDLQNIRLNLHYLTQRFQKLIYLEPLEAPHMQFLAVGGYY
jgi:hypothetical protein